MEKKTPPRSVILVDADLLALVKRRADLEGRTVKGAVARLLRAWVDSPQEQLEQPRQDGPSRSPVPPGEAKVERVSDDLDELEPTPRKAKGKRPKQELPPLVNVATGEERQYPAGMEKFNPLGGARALDAMATALFAARSARIGHSAIRIG